MAFPALVTIKGKVFAAQKDINLFTMSVRQYNDASQSLARLIVWVLMGFGREMDSLNQLPARDDVVSFTGKVVAFHHSVLLVVVDRVSVVPVDTDN